MTWLADPSDARGVRPEGPVARWIVREHGGDVEAGATGVRRDAVVVAVGLNRHKPIVWTETADRSLTKTNRQQTADARH